VPVRDLTLLHTRTERFWVYLRDARHPHVVYDYMPQRTSDGSEEFLEGSRGYLQGDAFTGYDRICAGPDVMDVACRAQMQRKFFESRSSTP
jgi:transposase